MISEYADLVSGVAAAGLWAGRSAIKGKLLPPPPMFTHCGKRRLHAQVTVEYAPGLKLDIWAPEGAHNAPVFFFIPGGAWILGQRRPQGYALMSSLVEQGWVCVAIDYRVAPKHRWPAPLEDVGTAYGWVRENIARYHGDPNFVVVGGASAGGHMAALAGLSNEFPFSYAPPQAVVGLYGAYDWESRHSPWRQAFMRYLETVVVGKSQARHPEVYRNANPTALVHEDAPPFLLLHGTADRLCLVGEARRFANRLGAVSKSLVQYYEIAGGAHAFDLINPRQTHHAVEAIHEFLDAVWLHHRIARVS